VTLVLLDTPPISKTHIPLASGWVEIGDPSEKGNLGRLDIARVKKTA
jgi:hypothetical protein